MKISGVLCLLLTLFAFMSNSYASQDPPEELHSSYQENLTRAIDLFYNAEWVQAQQQLDAMKEAYPTDTSVFFFDSMIPFWKYFFGGSNPDDAREFLDRSEKAIDISERKLRSAPRDTSTVLLLSGLYGYRSLVAASEREYRVAMRSGMTGFTYTRQLLALNSDDPNAQMGRGVFNYMMGTVPREIRWATSFAGLSGDRDEGILQLRNAAESDSYVSTDALMILTYFYLRDEMFDEALETSSELVSKYPANSIFQFYHAKSLEAAGKNEEARKSYQRVIELDNPQLPSLTEDAKSKLESI